MKCCQFPLNKSVNLISVAITSLPLLMIQTASAIEVHDFDALREQLSQSVGYLDLTLVNDISSTNDDKLIFNKNLSEVSINGNGHSIKWHGPQSITPNSSIKELRLSNLGKLSFSSNNKIIDIQSGLSNPNLVLPLIYQTAGGNLMLEKVVIANHQSAHTGGGGITFIGQTSNTIAIDQSAFINNESTANYGGALSILSKKTLFPFTNQTSGFIKESLFIGNKAISGGALYTGRGIEIGNGQANSSKLTIEDSLFESNSALSKNHDKDKGLGGAIYLSGAKQEHTIKNTSFISNHADQYGGAIAAVNTDLIIVADKKDVIFSKNSAGNEKSDFTDNRGDAIYLKDGKLLLKPSPLFKIIFKDSILTEGGIRKIDINEWLTPACITEEVQFHERVDNAIINLYGGTLSLLGDDNALETSSLSISFHPAKINLVNDHIQKIQLKELYATAQHPILLTVDVNLQNKIADSLNVREKTEASTNLNVSEWHVLEDNKTDRVVDVNITSTEALFDHLGLDLNGKVAYGDIYKWDVAYIGNGNYQFTRPDQPPVSPQPPEPPVPDTEEPEPEPEPEQKPELKPNDFNPDVYGPTMAVATLTHLQHEIASNLFREYTNQMVAAELEDQQPLRKTWWAMAHGGDFDWKTKNYSTLDIKYASAMIGHNFDPITLGRASIDYGVYLGGLYGKQSYASRNDIRQNAGFIGAQSSYSRDNFWVGMHTNIGLMYNNFKSPSIDQSEKTPWMSLGATIGYAIPLPQYSLVFSPSLTANYVYVDDFKVSTKNGTLYRLDNSHSWEVSPEVRLSKNFDNHLKGYISVRYALGNQKSSQSYANDVKLPKVELEDYAQYGLGLEKKTKNYAISVFSQYNNDGRSGWTGSLRYSWIIN